MTQYQAREVFEMGALVRGSFRREAFKLGLTVKEEKGLFESAFIVEGNSRSVSILREMVQDRIDREDEERWRSFLREYERKRRAQERRRRIWHITKICVIPILLFL